MEWAACRDARLGMGARGGGYAAGDAWYGGMGDRGTRLGMGCVAWNMRQGMHGMVGWAIGGDTVGDGGAWRGICGRGCMVCRGARPCAPTPCDHAWGVSPYHHAWGVSPCHHAWGVSPCHHARGVSPCAPNNRHQPIHHPDHRCPHAFTEPMTPIRRGARPCAPTPCDHAWGVPPCHHARGVPPCHHARGVPPCAPNNRHQPIHRPDHRCPNAFTEPMTPIRRGARPCAPTIAGVGYWVAECMGAPPCHHAWGAPPCHHAWGAPPCAPTCLPPTESRRG